MYGVSAVLVQGACGLDMAVHGAGTLATAHRSGMGAQPQPGPSEASAVHPGEADSGLFRLMGLEIFDTVSPGI